MMNGRKERDMPAQRNTIKSGNSTPRLYYTQQGRADLRRKPPEMRKSFQIAEMHDMHHEIARRLVIGQKPKQIAKDLNISYATVINTKNSPVVREQIDILSGARDCETVDIAKQIRDLAPKAVKVLEEILDDAETLGNLKAKVSFGLLDRAGHSTPKNINFKGIHAVVSSADLDLIKKRAVEIGLNSGVIDVESDN